MNNMTSLFSFSGSGNVNNYVVVGGLFLAQAFYNFLHYRNQRRKSEYIRKKCPYCFRQL